ncbi:hypothetical protein ATK30_4958 [Amycolatopsis echigonensis]|uniref:Uncharacterized protein n=1 Tax=Amycolatopsis echigonensis TaxID=2576905 RepID=A0A2N3WJP5_9PSEU|nr:hypothetical protein ATK30_4958 [Amycolatopsis niigatensis]
MWHQVTDWLRNPWAAVVISAVFGLLAPLLSRPLQSAMKPDRRNGETISNYQQTIIGNGNTQIIKTTAPDCGQGNDSPEPDRPRRTPKPPPTEEQLRNTHIAIGVVLIAATLAYVKYSTIPATVITGLAGGLVLATVFVTVVLARRRIERPPMWGAIVLVSGLLAAASLTGIFVARSARFHGVSIADAERLVATTPYLKTFRLLWTTYDGGVLMFLLAQAGGMLLLAAANLSFTRQLAGLLARVRLRDQPVGRVRRWLMNGYTVRGGTLWAHLLVAASRSSCAHRS